jgi:hypothetical protein
MYNWLNLDENDIQQAKEMLVDSFFAEIMALEERNDVIDYVLATRETANILSDFRVKAKYNESDMAHLVRECYKSARSAFEDYLQACDNAEMESQNAI